MIEGFGRHEPLTQTRDRIARVGYECCGIHKRQHVGPPGGRVRDHYSAVGVSDEDLRAWNAVERGSYCRDISGNRHQVKCWCRSVVAVLVERRNNLVPT